MGSSISHCQSPKDFFALSEKVGFWAPKCMFSTRLEKYTVLGYVAKQDVFVGPLV
jgi:hypothetical protein